MKSSTLLTILIVTAMVLGALVGEYVLFDPSGEGDLSTWKRAGDLILIRPLKLLVIPLVLFSVVAGITRIGDPRKLGVVGGATLVYYFATMIVAVTIGALLVTAIQPGGLSPDVQLSLQQTGEAAFMADTQLQERVSGDVSEQGAWIKLLYQLIPSNVIERMSAGQPLGIIIFAIGLGLAFAAGEKKPRPPGSSLTLDLRD